MADAAGARAGHPTACLTLDLNGYITSWDAGAAEWFGYPSESALGRHWWFLSGEGPSDGFDLSQLDPALDEVVQSCRARDSEGRPMPMRMILQRVRDTEGRPEALRVRYEPELRPMSDQERLRLYVSIIDDSSQGVLVTDANERIVMVNAAFTRLTGYTADEALGKTPDLLRSGQHSSEFRQQVRHAMQGAGLWIGEILGRRKNGEIFPQSVCVSTVRDEAGQVTHAFSIFSDISGHKETEARLQRLANFDSVTGLPNRMLLGELLDQTVQVARRNHDHGALLVIQLHRVNWIYDTLGHRTGDAYMVQVTERLRGALRDQDTLARLSHDKLAVVLQRIQKREHAGLVGQKLLHLLHAPCVLEGHELHGPASIGIAVYPENGHETTGLLRAAELANQRGLDQGEHVPTYFSEEMNQRALERFRLEGELRHAIGHGELVLYHQPKVSLRNGRIVGAEALLRWQHPRHDLLGPGHFVPLAEESSLILELGEWVLHEACRQLRDWQQRGLKMPPLAVNLSARQFDKYLPQRLDAMLNLYGIAPQQLRLEITESLMVRGPDQVVPIMNELAAMGLRMALDDFGTGYSSLAYLKKFPISTLKIDRAFVLGIPDDANDGAIARAIVTMAQQLRQEIVAEGVEHRDQMAFLREIGCDQLQGYLFSPPVPAEVYERMVSDDVRLALD
jgi:PAS domain S-box-containing protein/diguanylate cyclase (GGDEF)-like protein